MFGAMMKQFKHNKAIGIRSSPGPNNLTIAESMNLKKRDDANNLQWSFPPGTTDETSDVAAGFGPVYPEDVIIIEYTPEDQMCQINLYCDWNDGNGAFQIATRNSNGSPMFWHLIETASLKNGNAPVCHFASASSSNIWSASTMVGPPAATSEQASATPAASTAQPASSAAAKSSAAAPASSATSAATQPTSPASTSSAIPRVVTVTAAGGSIIVQTQAVVTSTAQQSGSASRSTTSSATSSASGTAIPIGTQKSTTHTTAIAVSVSVSIAVIASLALILLFLHKRRKSAKNFQAISDTSRPSTKPTGPAPQALANNGRMGGQGIEMVPREKSQYVEPYVNTTELGGDSIHQNAYPAPAPVSGYPTEKGYPPVAEMGGQAVSPQQAYPAVPPTYAYEMPAQYGQQSGGHRNELA